MGKKIKEVAKKIAWFILNPKLLLCLGIAWIITNGWSYMFLALGTALDIRWMTAIGGGYVAFLWFPFSPEKLLTVAIAIALLRLLFPNDQKTLQVLKSMMSHVREQWRNRKKRKNEESTQN